MLLHQNILPTSSLNLLAMKNKTFVTYLSLFISLLIAGCIGGTREQMSDGIDFFSDDEKATMFKTTYHSPVAVDSSDIIIFQINFNNNKKSRKFKSSYNKKSGYYNYSTQNLLFFNCLNDSSYLLMPDSAIHIARYHVNNYETYGQYAAKYIFYEIRKPGRTAYNNNPEYLYVSDIDGSNFRQLSPDSSHLNYWAVPGKNNVLIMNYLTDSNHDGKFSFQDKEKLIKIDLTDLSSTKNLVTPEMDAILENQHPKPKNEEQTKNE